MSRETDKILEVAKQYISYHAPDDPEPGSLFARNVVNIYNTFPNAEEAHKRGVLYWEGGTENWLLGPSTEVYWCCLFATYVVMEALWQERNPDIDSFSGIPGFPNYQCDFLLRLLRDAGKGDWILPNKRDAQPGDIIFFDWNSGNASNHYTGIDHVGIVEANCGSYVQTIEGNTGSGTSSYGYSSNGVYRRTRDWGTVACVLHPPYSELVVWKDEVAPPRTTPRPTGNEEGGSEGPVYRLYNPNSEQHLYTQDKNEYDVLSTQYGWNGEGVSFEAAATGDKVYRLYNPYTGEHMFTKDLNEAQVNYDAGWDFEGIAWHSSGKVPVWRLYNKYNGQHIYVTDNYEHAMLADAGWSQEGVAFWAVK